MHKPYIEEAAALQASDVTIGVKEEDTIWQISYELAIKQLVVKSLRLWEAQVLGPEMFSSACDGALALLLFYTAYMHAMAWSVAKHHLVQSA